MNDEQRAALAALIKDSWQTAEDHGWHQDEELYREVSEYVDTAGAAQDPMWKRILKRLGSESYGVQVMEKLMLVVTELAESAEDYRKAGLDLRELYWLDEQGVKHPMTVADAKAGRKPLGFPSEAADVQIRINDLSESLGVDLVHAIECKAEYNRHREFRHGNKRS